MLWAQYSSNFYHVAYIATTIWLTTLSKIFDFGLFCSAFLCYPPLPPQFVTPLISRLSFSIIISSLSLYPFVYFNFCPSYLCHVIIRLAPSPLCPSFKFMLSQTGTFVLQNLYYRNFVPLLIFCPFNQRRPFMFHEYILFLKTVK